MKTEDVPGFLIILCIAMAIMGWMGAHIATRQIEDRLREHGLNPEEVLKR